MFGFLKKKLSKVVDSLTQKVEEKPEVNQESQPEPVAESEPAIEAPVEKAEEIPEIDIPETDSEVKVEEPETENDKIEEPKIMEPGPAAKSEIETADLDEDFSEKIEKVDDDIHPVSEIVKNDPDPAKADPLPIIEKKSEVEMALESDRSLEAETAVEKEIETKPEPEPEPVVEVVEKKEKKSFFGKLTEGIVKKVTEKKLSEKDVVPVLEELETSMIESDVAVEVAEKVKNDLRGALVDQPIKRGKEKDVVFDSLRSSLLNVLDVPNLDLDAAAKEKKPVLITFLGFNGAGKTTSLAKTASWLKEKGYTCVLAAADTFRAGAEEQLEIHAERIGFKVVKHKYGADPAAVIFDAVEHAKAKGIDFVLADTAGRAHTNNDLMDQMKKIIRVNKPDINILVIDSLVGNDAVLQARMYNEVGVDALVFTKVDVNEKGGAILSVTHELKKPILFLGLGQEYKDFQVFESKSFVDNLLN